MFLELKLVKITKLISVIFIAWLVMSAASYANASTIPSSAEIDRIKAPTIKTIQTIKLPEQEIPKIGLPSIEAPEIAKTFHIVFKKINIEGVTVFSNDELVLLYQEYLNKDTTLDVAWIIAARLTKKYNDNGYFLSRAYVPAQDVTDGTLTIKVVEGYIGKIELQNPDESNYIINQLIRSFKQQRPLKAEQIESFLLKLNDLPGQKFKAVLSNLDSDDEAAAQMELVSDDSDSNYGYINIDNYGSRFIGPSNFSAFYITSPAPLNQSNFSVSASLPADEVKFGSFEHITNIAPDVKLGFHIEKTVAHPGYTLKASEIDSDSNGFGFDAYFQLIRQRQENLSFKFSFDSKNTNTNLLGNQISHDQIRVLRAGTYYDFFDELSAYNSLSLEVSQGINVFGSSQAGDINLTRADAKPNFTKASLTMQRQQAISDNITLVSSTSMQRASGTLYSSEQFGYGGQGFGRAFDASDILGDHGIVGSLEMRYRPQNIYDSIYLSPYAFYDIGKVWSVNPSSGEPKSLSGTSIGFGTRFSSDGISGNLGLAFPLTRDVTTPIYGHDESAPRILLQMSKSF